MDSRSILTRGLAGDPPRKGKPVLLLAVAFSLGPLPAGSAGSDGSASKPENLPCETTIVSESPNMLVILVDDMGFSDIGSYGGEVETPALDRLAADGLRSTGFHNTSRCWPTRATLLTGNYRSDLKPDEPTIAEVAKEAGYQTAMVGKWHLGNRASYPVRPNQRGFDDFYGTLGGAGSYWEPPKLMRDTESVQLDTDGYYYTEKIGSEAVRQIHEFAAKDQPFFHYVAFTAPHWPLHAPEAAIQKYIDRYRHGWHALREERYARMIEMGIIDSERWPLPKADPEVKDWDMVEHKEWHIRNMAIYAAMIELLDREVGRIIDTLRETGQLQNTLIVFCSDNGASSEDLRGPHIGSASNLQKRAEQTGETVTIGNDPAVPNGGPNTFGSVNAGWAHAQNTPLPRFKANVRAGGSLSPAIFFWPAGMPTEVRTTITDANSHIVDLMATFCDLAGIQPPANAGRSFLPLVKGEELDPDFPYFFKHNHTRAIIRGDYKLVQEQDGPWQLYDLSQNKTETRDLAGQQPELVIELETLWEELDRQFRN